MGKSAPDEFIRKIRKKIEEKYGLELEDPSLLRIGSTGSLVLDCGLYIVRLPQTNSACNFCITNFKMLTEIGNYNLSISTPKPIVQGCINGQNFFVESKINGISMDLYKLSSKNSSKVLNEAISFLTDKKIIFGNMDKKKFSLLVKYQIDQICLILKKEHQLLMKNIIQLMHDKFIGKDLPIVLCHGDFKFSNFLCNNDMQNQLVGIIDWEYGVAQGLPLFDLATLLIWNVKPWSASGQTMAKRFVSFTNSSDNLLVISYLKSMKISRSLLIPLSIMFIIIK